jgi:outer membrane protein assembly factor BamA
MLLVVSTEVLLNLFVEMKVKLLRYLYLCVAIFFLQLTTIAQNVFLEIQLVDKSNTTIKELGLKNQFANLQSCIEFTDKLPAVLQSKGFLSASIDTIIKHDATVKAKIFLGEKYIWHQLKVDENDWPLLSEIGIKKIVFQTEPFNPEQVKMVQEKLLDYFEVNGYPFAVIRFDSLLIEERKVSAKLVIEKGVLYKMDSIRLFGNAKISKQFLYRYLDIQPNSLYNSKKLEKINQRFLELPYLQQTQPWRLSMLGKAYLLDVFANNKKSNQIDAIVGFLPNNQQLDGALLFTIDAKLKLQNAFAKGEVIGLNWQQIQPKSPRLNILYQQPYIFNSKFGLDFSFDLFKKDSSFLNLQTNIGVSYEINTKQKTKILLQSYRTNLLDVDTLTIKFTKKLPDIIDVVTNSLAVEYEISNTNYKFNPRKGEEMKLVLSAGSRKILQNNTVTQIKDASFNYQSLYDSLDANTYQARVKLNGTKYIPIGKYSVLKTAVQFGLVQSPTIFRNEMFQIGGFKTVRGFDEESIFASKYAVGTIEYRYLFGLNAYFSGFTDFGYTYNSIVNKTYNYVGFGGGLAFETKQGVFNINIAAGKRNDLNFDLRQTKIHIGFVSLF